MSEPQGAMYFGTDPQALCARLLHGSDDHETSMVLRREAAHLIEHLNAAARERDVAHASQTAGAIGAVLQMGEACDTLRAQLASSRAEQIRLSLQVSILTNERDEARARGSSQ